MQKESKYTLKPYDERFFTDDFFFTNAWTTRSAAESPSVNAGEKFPDFAGLKFPLSGKKIY